MIMHNIYPIYRLLSISVWNSFSTFMEFMFKSFIVSCYIINLHDFCHIFSSTYSVQALANFSIPLSFVAKKWEFKEFNWHHWIWAIFAAHEISFSQARISLSHNLFSIAYFFISLYNLFQDNDINVAAIVIMCIQNRLLISWGK